MPAISVLMKPSSSMCNMSCNYCFYCDEAQKRTQESFGYMSEQTLKNIIRKTMLRAEGMISYTYQGGEPTLRGVGFFKKAIEFQNQYNRNHVQVQNALQTNGYAITEEWCQFFKDNHFLIGLSVDGTEEIHNSTRPSHPDYSSIPLPKRFHLRLAGAPSAQRRPYSDCQSPIFDSYRDPSPRSCTLALD